MVALVVPTEIPRSVSSAEVLAPPIWILVALSVLVRTSLLPTMLASTFVDGVTYVPDQLTRAINSTFALASDHHELEDYLRDLARSELTT